MCMMGEVAQWKAFECVTHLWRLAWRGVVWDTPEGAGTPDYIGGEGVEGM